MTRLTAIVLLLLSACLCLQRGEWHVPTAPSQKAASAAECENTSGVIGFGVVSFGEKTAIPFFAHPVASKRPVQVVRFYHEPAVNSLSFRAEGKEAYSLLRPEAHKLDYDIFDLPVRARRDGWLEVVADEESGRTLWVRERIRPSALPTGFQRCGRPSLSKDSSRAVTPCARSRPGRRAR